VFVVVVVRVVQQLHGVVWSSRLVKWVCSTLHLLCLALNAAVQSGRLKSLEPVGFCESITYILTN